MKNRSFFNTLSLKRKKSTVDNNHNSLKVSKEKNAQSKFATDELIDSRKIAIPSKILTEDEEDCLADVFKENVDEKEKLKSLFLFPLEEVMKISLNHEKLIDAIKKLNHFFKSKQVKESFSQLVSDIDSGLKEIINPMISHLTQENKKVAQDKLLYMLNSFQNKLDDLECKSIQKQNDQQDENGYMIMKGIALGVFSGAYRAKEILNELPPPLPHRNSK